MPPPAGLGAGVTPPNWLLETIMGTLVIDTDVWLGGICAENNFIVIKKD